jgi:hypothetical protein
MTRKMTEHNFGEVQDELASFIASTPKNATKHYYGNDQITQPKISALKSILDDLML